MMVSTAVLPNAREPEFSFGNFRLWTDGSFLRDQTQIHLPPKEMAALRFLLTHAGEVVTPTQLKQALWGDLHVTSDSVPRCLSSLRARLEPEQCIQTIYKRGYRLIGPVLQSGSPARPVWHVAIMPFATGHNVAEHLGLAIAEEVTTRLTAAGPSWVSVLARDSVFTLAHRGLTAVQVGETLHADFILAGTLIALPTHYRLRAEMIRVADGVQVWVEDMLVAQNLVLDLESQLVQRLIFRLGGKYSPPPNAELSASLRSGAYDVFLRGHQEWQTHERHRMQDGMQHLLEATELDPSLISAQIDLADLSATQELYGFLSPDAAARQIRRIADSISDTATDAPGLLPILGWINFHVDRNLAAALDLFSASAHLPHTASTTRLRVMFALSRHRFDEALQWLRPALFLDPFAPWLHSLLAWTLHLSGRRGSSLEAAEKAVALFPDHEGTLANSALILSFNGHAEHGEKLARDLARRTPYFDIATAIHAYALACSGQRGEAYGILERLQWLSRERFVLRSFIPAAFAALGSVDEAISELQAADDARCPWFFQVLADPRLQPLYGHAEFELMRESLEKLEFSAAENLEYQT
jgi:DNA-binding winged helix-turn-helix (wHTH) protein/tetratricopeptide (TPR) repeat protein